MKYLQSSLLRKTVALFLLTFLVNQVQAQMTPRFNVSTSSNTNGFYEYLPQGYAANPNQTYPLIIFLHGVGELGSGNEWDLPRLLNGGLPADLQAGLFPTNGINVGGQNYKFIVLCPQFVAWPQPWDVDGVINYAISHYRVNASRIYLTGLSMGGGAVWEYAGYNSTYANRIAAIVPMAGASWPDHGRARTIAQANIAVWALHNNYDPTVPVWYTNSYVDQINEAPAPAPMAKKSIFESGSHDVWTPAYDGYTRDETGRNVFEWMLQFSKGYVPPSVPFNQVPSANAGPDQVITGTSVQLNGSATDPDGTIASYLWTKVAGPSQFTFSNASIANPVVSNLAGGVYTFRLTVTDNSGGMATDDVVVNVPSSKIEAESYTIMNGIGVESTSDVGGGMNVGWQDNADWMDYLVNVPTAGTYTVSFRVASPYNGAQFQLRKSDWTILSTMTVPNTGGTQTWQTISTQVTLPAGLQTLKIYTLVANGGWNINWWQIQLGGTANQAPTANAGTAQTITLPASSVNLSGSATDADGSISSYAWTQVSGPSQASFSNAAAAATTANGLVQGSYVFKLTATDNGGASASSTVAVTVNAASGTTPSASIHIEAESYTAMFGIQTENTSDAGGGKNVGWQDDNDWMDYSVNVPTAGTYTVSFRVASLYNGAQFQLRKSDWTILSTVTVPNTGGTQTWQTVTAQVTLPAGQQTLKIFTLKANGGWNINWWEIGNAGATPTPPVVTAPSLFHIEAENYSSMFGIQTENTSDAGGGLNVGWQDNNDWMDYSVNIPTAGTYTVSFRVASLYNGAQFQLRKSDWTVLSTITVPNTGGTQVWQTVTAQVALPAGQQTLKIFTAQANGGWNINWWEIASPVAGTVSTASTEATEVVTASSIEVFPNPVQDKFMLQVDNNETGAMKVSVVNMNGAVQKQFNLNKAAAGSMQTYLSLGNLPKGEYVLSVSIGKWKETKKMIKL